MAGVQRQASAERASTRAPIASSEPGTRCLRRRSRATSRVSSRCLTGAKWSWCCGTSGGCRASPPTCCPSAKSPGRGPRQCLMVVATSCVRDTNGLRVPLVLDEGQRLCNLCMILKTQPYLDMRHKDPFCERGGGGAKLSVKHKQR
ncbi:unnamed protein product [Phaeothamnion confervicola]